MGSLEDYKGFGALHPQFGGIEPHPSSLLESEMNGAFYEA